MMNEGTTTKEATMNKVYARNKATGKRYLILRDIRGNLDMSKASVNGISARDDGTTHGPIRTLRTDKLTVEA
jgi:hypothetical protein